MGRSLRSSDEGAAIVALVRPVTARMAHLNVEARLVLLSALLAQELCNLPPGERDDELRRVTRDLPMILDATERGMRLALARNARND